MAWGIKLLCILGLLVSLYALWIEVNVFENPNYVAFCDLHQYISCSKVLTSKYSQGFGVIGDILGEKHFLNMPNCVYGILYYLIYLTLDTVHQNPTVTKLKFTLSASSLVMCLYLGYILAFILRDLCLVCFATYMINVCLAIPAFTNYYNLCQRQLSTKEKRK